MSTNNKDHDSNSSTSSSKYTYQPTDSKSSGSSMNKWVGFACVVGAGLALRVLFKGTAPSTASKYSRYMNHKETAPHRPFTQQTNTKPHHSHQHQHQSQHHHHQQHHSNASHQHHHKSSSHQQQQQHQHHQQWSEQDEMYNRKWQKAKSDFEKLEEARRTAAETWNERMAQYRPSDYAKPWTPFRDYDPEFELFKEQARADYIQSKFRLKRAGGGQYEAWRGGAANKSSFDEETAIPKYKAYKTMQQQLANNPRYVWARQLLFGDGSLEDPPSFSDSDHFFVPLSSHTHATDSTDPPPFLTTLSVRKAYYARAKECHPDMVGGNKEQFQRLTDAYELLMEYLEPIEKLSTTTAANKPTK